MTLLQEWISPQYLQLKKIEKFRSAFLGHTPFPYLELKGFFRKQKIMKVLPALRKEMFIRKEADLFQFSQTQDLVSTKSKILQKFRSFLSSPELVTYLSNLTNTNLKAKEIDMSGTLYQDTDFLLCHDDRLEGRKIAYFVYLSTLDRKDGGRLLLYDQLEKVAASIIPTFNTFAFFAVSAKSLHVVEEMVRPKQRLAISGWFHDQ
ncbi:TPA: hypothetical protein HA242_04320 [Candidatus Woesearchaeota archaeon]|nr:hypothetical protein [Candidatus Woesearchaeota archaeon]